MRILLTICLFIIGSYVFSQNYAGSEKVVYVMPKGASCTPPTTSTYLSVNNVKALIHTAGNLWQVPGQNIAQYEIPKNSGIMALFTSALWLGGVDINGQLKLAALRYRDGQDYWTGPLSQGAAETTYENCQKYDKHFVTTQDAVREFDAWFQTGLDDLANGTSNQADQFPNYVVPEIIKNWPAHGDLSQGQDYYLAPFYDRNNDGEYNYADGDYPWHDITKTKDCKTDRRVSLYGDVNYWWVMNDKGNIHTETGADPIGMEIRAQAFAFASNDEINNMTFYNYELINRGTQTLYNTYFGNFTDGALGDPFDDFVGCDVNRGLAYYYNGDNFDDDNNGFYGYKDNPPAVGVDFFEGPFQDDDGIDNAFGIGPGEALNGIGYGDGIIDNERYGMRRFTYYSNLTNGALASQTDPINAPDYYNYLQGKWKDGSFFYYGGSGHGSDPDANTSVKCDFMFPGDTDPLGWGTNGVPQPEWTEQTAGNVPNDRRFVQSAGPFILKPGAVNNITVGVVWARALSIDPFQSVVALRRADDKAQALFENCFKVLDAPHAPVMQAQELENEVILSLSNPLNSNNYNENYTEFDPFIVATDPGADKFYSFQGYLIYQLKSNQISFSDVEDANKARLVAQCDIKDGISKIINFEYDADIGASTPTLKVEGADDGIRHTFQITEDQFAQGNRTLVNFKRYYYVAIAYAYNNYENYDPNDPTALEGQKKLFISSRKAPTGEIKILECIPHNPSPETNGTIQSLPYGSGPQITRLDGHGNGSRILELTASSLSTIINNGYTENPVYDYGKGPIGVKVIDPLNVVGGYFECKFSDYSTSNSNGADTAKWTIYRYDEPNGNILDFITSDMTIERDNEQVIPEWGVSVQIHQESYYAIDGLTGGIEIEGTDLLSQTITYQDSTKSWLSYVEDNSANFPTNWIRNGVNFTIDGMLCDNSVPYINPCNFPDEAEVEKWAGALNLGFAPHRLVGYQSDYMPLAYFNYPGPAAARKNSAISFLPSVDIVITADKSKWTRCPVIEMGRQSALNVGNCQAGAMRKSVSVDKNGNPDGSGTTGMGWFPGYAIDVESGARLYMAFGENSFLVSDKGADMLWNPSSRLVDVNGNPIFGGVQPVYVYSFQNKSKNSYTLGYDFPAYKPSDAENLATNVLYQHMLLIEGGNNAQKRNTYGSISWIGYPLLKQGQQFLATDVTLKLRVNKEFKNFSNPSAILGGPNNGKPMYSWSMNNIETQYGSRDRMSEILDIINVVPNPYKAFSEYENNRIDSRVKITNLPDRCSIKIYTTHGKLIKSFEKDSPDTYQDWQLTNHAGIAIASGVYLIHVEVPDVGERILKAYVVMRQVDLQNI